MADTGHILVVDDDRDLQRLVEKQLALHGFEVTTADHGLDALVKLESMRPALMICDVNMPHLDGIELAKALKAREDTRSMPIIFLTAQSDPMVMVNGINVGARFYITKPFDMNELIWKVKRVLAKARK